MKKSVKKSEIKSVQKSVQKSEQNSESRVRQFQNKKAESHKNLRKSTIFEKADLVKNLTSEILGWELFLQSRHTDDRNDSVWSLDR